MRERRVLSDQEVVDLVTGLRSLDWSWDPDGIDRVVERFGWTIESRRRRFVRMDAGFGSATGYVDFSRDGTVDSIRVAVSGSESAESADGRACVQDAFARVVAAATRALGEPTERVPGDSPEVRWRGDDATIGVTRSLVRANVYLATNEYVDEADRDRESGL